MHTQTASRKPPDTSLFFEGQNERQGARCHDDRINILYPLFIASIFTLVCPSVHLQKFLRYLGSQFGPNVFSWRSDAGRSTMQTHQWFYLEFSSFIWDLFQGFLNVAICQQCQILLPLCIILEKLCVFT